MSPRSQTIDGQDLSLDAARRRHIEQVMAMVGGVKRRTAQLLRVSRTTLDAMLRKYGGKG